MSDTMDEVQDAQDEQEGARQEAADNAAYAQPTQGVSTQPLPAAPIAKGSPAASTIAPDAPMFSVGPAVASQPQDKGATTWGDYGKDLYTSVVSTGADALGAAKWAW